MGTLEETIKTLEEVRNVVHGLTLESKQLIHSANQITADVKNQKNNLDKKKILKNERHYRDLECLF